MRRVPLNGTQSWVAPFPCQRQSHRPCFLEEGSSARLRDLPESSQLIERPGFRAARLSVSPTKLASPGCHGSSAFIMWSLPCAGGEAGMGTHPGEVH